MDKELTEMIEIRLFIDVVKQQYAFDLSQYRISSIKRRIKDLVRKKNLNYISDLIPYVLHKPEFHEELINQISVRVSDFFRDPFVYKRLANQIVNRLLNNQSINVWCAGCATGEEAYSLAIVFKELGLLHKTQITATDMCQQTIDMAKKGIYSNEKIRQYSSNYQLSGGQTSFNYYFTSRYEWIKINEEIMNSISFQQHNLLTDNSFKKKHLIVCRNVLIYFSDEAQEQVFRFLSNALVKQGLLLLGPQDSLYSSILESDFEVIDEKARLYKKTN